MLAIDGESQMRIRVELESESIGADHCSGVVAVEGEERKDGVEWWNG